MALKDRVGRYENRESGERGVYANLGNNGLQAGTYANKYGGVGGYLDRGNANLLQGGINVADDNSYNVGGAMAFPATQNFYNEVQTPFGMLSYGANAATPINSGNVYGDFTPNNQYYLQALANLLSGR